MNDKPDVTPDDSPPHRRRAGRPRGSKNIPLSGQVLRRVDGRALDLDTLRGTARAHATLLRSFLAGQMPADEFDAASKGLWRHSNILRAPEELEAAMALAAKLDAIQAGPQPLRLEPPPPTPRPVWLPAEVAGTPEEPQK